ncbi:hypothetical protein [Pleionea sediminis]|nr:hypothetical protein [Pleionea sediminis]
MLVTYEWFEVLVWTALGLSTLAPLVLLVLALIDWKKEQLW